MRWEWKMFLVAFMIWMTKNAAAYMSKPDISQMKDYGPSMTYKDWNPNRSLQ